MLLVLALAPAMASGQPSDATVAGAESVEMPHNGMTMNAVRERYGAPDNERAPVGWPPIARWEYPGYTVYFEGNLVITSVDDTGFSPGRALASP